LKTADFDYKLPQELIAQSPLEPRDHSRLMIMDRKNGRISHRKFYDVSEYLDRGDVLVFNDSRVIPARMFGSTVDRGSRVELLLLSQISPNVWKTLVKPGRRMRKGTKFLVNGTDGKQLIGRIREQYLDGSRKVEFESELNFEYFGSVPLPPYIHETMVPTDRYQTVYAQKEGSIAAPTAGLHFTKNLLNRISAKGVSLEFVTLHVGWDSFRPLKTNDPSEHRMHSEYWELSRDVCNRINLAKTEGRRVISVGTTVVRLLENAARINLNSLVSQHSTMRLQIVKPASTL